MHITTFPLYFLGSLLNLHTEPVRTSQEHASVASNFKTGADCNKASTQLFSSVITGR
jgi:hypothetical protein